MRRIAVVQWSRLGDLLQTRVLLRRLRRERPEHALVLSADARYAELVRQMPKLNEFWPVDLARLSALAKHAQSHGALLQAIAALCRQPRPDRESASSVMRERRIERSL